MTNNDFEKFMLDKISVYLNENFSYSLENGAYCYKVYTDSNDMIDNDTLKEISSIESYEDALHFIYNHINHCYHNYISDTENDFVKNMISYFENHLSDYEYTLITTKNFNVVSVLKEFLLLHNLLRIYVDYDDILKSTKVKIFYDFNSNTTKNDYCGNLLGWCYEAQQKVLNNEVIKSELPVYELLLKQGFTFDDFVYEVESYKLNKRYMSSFFLKTLIESCESVTSSYSKLGFITSVTLYDYFHIEKFSITNTSCDLGFYDEYYFRCKKITIDKDFEIDFKNNKKLIFN